MVRIRKGAGISNGPRGIRKPWNSHLDPIRDEHVAVLVEKDLVSCAKPAITARQSQRFSAASLRPTHLRMCLRCWCVMSIVAPGSNGSCWHLRLLVAEVPKGDLRPLQIQLARFADTSEITVRLDDFRKRPREKLSAASERAHSLMQRELDERKVSDTETQTVLNPDKEIYNSHTRTCFCEP